MAIPLAVAAALAAAPAVIQGVQAYGQNRKAKEFAKAQRPKFETPSEITSALKNAEMMAQQRKLPGQDLIEQKMDADTAAAYNRMNEASTNPAMSLGALSNLTARQGQNRNALGVQAANYVSNQQANLRNMQNVYGGWQNRQWDYNLNQPYQQSMAAASALRNAAMRNLQGAANSLASGGMSLYGMGEYNKLLGAGVSSGMNNAANRAAQIGNFLSNAQPQAREFPNMKSVDYTPVRPMQQQNYGYAPYPANNDAVPMFYPTPNAYKPSLLSNKFYNPNY